MPTGKSAERQEREEGGEGGQGGGENRRREGGKEGYLIICFFFSVRVDTGTAKIAMGRAVYLKGSFFNHSCRPNVFFQQKPVCPSYRLFIFYLVFLFYLISYFIFL